MTLDCYLVGGAVRDQLLGRPVCERDWVVVGATPEQLLAEGFRQADPEFPVFLHPQSGEEYALARRETKIGEGYRGFAVDCSPGVTLEQDLARRDLTVNAMALAPDGTLFDPFGGRQDLEAGRLRHVGPAFVEDPVRLLRIARFAAKLGEGFRVAHDTHRLLKRMVAEGAPTHLQGQRVGQEMTKALACEAPWRFFQVLAACGALSQWMPGLATAIGRGAHVGSECEPVRALRRASADSGEPALRLAALLAQSGDDAQALAGDWVLTRPLRELAIAVQSAWEAWQALDLDDADALVAFLGRLRAWQPQSQCESILLALQAQSPDRARIDRLRRAWELARGISAQALQAQGLQGAELGQALARARVEAVQRQP